MGQYRPSLLILRGKPTQRRIRPRRGSLNNAVRDQRLSDLEWAEDRRQREGGRLTKAFLLINASDFRVHEIAEEFRHVGTQVKLNTAEIDLIKSRERPGWGVTEKGMHWDLTNKNSDEILDLQEHDRVTDEWKARVEAEIEQIKGWVGSLQRTVGEEPDA